MLKYGAETTIQASAEKIWAILIDGVNYPHWDPGMAKLEGRIALGEKITAHTTFSDRAFPVKVSEFVPNKKMVWSSGMPLGLFKGARSFVLTENGDKTHVRVEEVFSGPMVRFFPIPDLQPHFDNFVNGLKEEAEK